MINMVIGKKKMSEQKQQLKEWVIQNMIDIEADKLDEKKRKMFLDLVSEFQNNDFMQECYIEFEKRKAVVEKLLKILT